MTSFVGPGDLKGTYSSRANTLCQSSTFSLYPLAMNIGFPICPMKQLDSILLIHLDIFIIYISVIPFSSLPPLETPYPILLTLLL